MEWRTPASSARAPGRSRCRSPSTRPRASPSRPRRCWSGSPPRTRLIIVNSPANPTGGVVPQAEIDALARGLERFPDVAVLSDEIYARMCDDGVPHASLLPYGIAPRPADPARRLVQDLRDDRLAARLGRVAGALAPWRPGSRSTSTPAWVRPPSGPASRPCGPQDSVERMVAEFDRRRDVIVAELNRIPASAACGRAAPSTPSRTSRARARARASSRTSCWTSSASR